MPRRSSLRLLVFATATSLFGFVPLLHADDDPWHTAMGQAHDFLMKAHDESDVAQRESDLKQAKSLIYHAKPNPQGARREHAESLIGSAIYELKKGDPRDLVNQYIEQANRVIGF